MKPPTRLAIFATLVWLLFLAVANYATVCSKTEFAVLADGQPLRTLIVHDAGWPVPWVQQVYDRVPYSHTTWDIDGADLSRDVFLIVLVHVALASLVWRKTAIKVWDLLAVTTVAAIVMTSAVSSEARFGGTVSEYAALYAYFSPVAIAGIRLPAQIVNAALWVFRSTRNATTEIA